jgi:hypothetical protein
MAEILPAPAATWWGSVEQYVVGDPGRAASATVPLPDPENWNRQDTVVDGVTITAGRDRLGELRAVSVRGLVHRHYGRVRQDEYAYRRTPDGRYLVLSVADGVSRGTQSHHAAAAAARNGTRRLASLVDGVAPGEIDWPSFIGEVTDAVVRAGRKRLSVLKVPGAEEFTHRELAEHLATTVLFAVLDLHADQDGHRVDLCAVGDTSAWVLRADGWEPLQPVKNEGATLYSPSVHAMPTAPPELALPMRTVVRPGEVLVLMSDGIGDALGAGTGEVGAFLAEVWQRPPAPIAFAAQADFARKSFDDDRTAIAFWPQPRP